MPINNLQLKTSNDTLLLKHAYGFFGAQYEQNIAVATQREKDILYSVLDAFYTYVAELFDPRYANHYPYVDLDFGEQSIPFKFRDYFIRRRAVLRVMSRFFHATLERINQAFYKQLNAA